MSDLLTQLNNHLNQNRLDQLSQDRILRLPEVCLIVSLSRQTLYRYMAMSPRRFPQSVKIGISAVGWRRSHVLQWLQEREIESSPIDYSVH